MGCRSYGNAMELNQLCIPPVGLQDSRIIRDTPLAKVSKAFHIIGRQALRGVIQQLLSRGIVSQTPGS